MSFNVINRMIQFTNDVKRKAIESVINGSPADMLQRQRALLLLDYYSPSNIEVRNIKVDRHQIIMLESLYQCLVLTKKKKSSVDAAKVLCDFCPDVPAMVSVMLLENDLVFPTGQPS